MATTTSTHIIGVTDNGTLRQVTTNANKAADAINGIERKSKAASKALAQTESDRMGYDQARAGGGTGAAGRDFAKQSQGLGGLVRVYATFAANLFAVSAAYNALSQAQDTANLVKGLDQLGAASGRNLGTLAKDIVKATDNAVSLREAMTATAQASAAGMSNKDILRMADGAKKASQALGVDMSDALSRISRGITKLEPELLDEIGIFVRVDKASQDYAKSIGKPVSALTDLEKRAAFANAALTQVEKKFGEVTIDSNPYTQLLASMKNMATEGLNLVNKVLGPLVSMLASSPGALSAVMFGIGTMLLNQAIPAISQYRNELRKAAKDSADFAIARSEEANKARTAFLEAQTAPIRKQLEQIALDSEAAVDNAQAALEKKSKKGLDKKTQALLLDPELLDETNPRLKEYISHLDAMGSKTDAAGNLTKVSARYRELSTSIQDAITAQANFMVKDAELRATVAAAPPKGSREAALIDRADLLKKASDKAQVVSQAADTANLIGFKQAWEELKASVSSLDLKPGEKYFTMLKGGVAAATAGIISLGSKLINLVGWVGAIISIGSMMLSWLKDNEKQSVAASDALTKLEESSDNLVRTTERLSKLDPLEKVSADSLNAKANAIRDLSQTTSAAIEKVSAEVASRDLSERLVSGLAGWFNSNAESDLAETIATGVTNAIKLAESSPELADSKKKLLELTGGKTGSALVSLLKNTKGLQGQISSALSDMEKTVSAFSNTAQAAKTSAAELGKARTDLFNSFKVNDPLSNFGRAGVAASVKLAEALKSPIANMTTIREVAQDIASSGLLPTSSAVEIQNITTKLEDAQSAYLNLISKRDEYYKQGTKLSVDERNATLNTPSQRKESGGYMSNKDKIESRQAEYMAMYKASSEGAEKYKAALEKGADDLKKYTNEGIRLGTAFLQQKLSQSFAEAKLTVSKAYAGLLSGTTGGISAQATLDKKAVDIQNVGIATQLTLIQSQAEQTIALQENTVALNEISLSRMKEEAAKPGGNTRSMRDAIDNLTAQNTKLKSDTEQAAKIIRNPKSTLSSLEKSTLDPGIRAVLSNYLEQKQSAQGTIAKGTAQKQATDISAKAQIAEKTALDIAKATALKDSEANASKENALKILKEYGAITEEVYARESASVEQEKSRIAYAKERAELEADWDKKREVMEATWGTELFKDSKNATAEAYTRLVTLDSSYEASKRLTEESGAATLFIAKQNDYSKQYLANQTLQLINDQITLSAAQDTLTIRSEALEKLHSEGRISEDLYSMKKAALDNESAAIKYQNELLDINVTYQKGVLEAVQTIEKLRAGVANEQDYANVSTQLQTLAAARDQGLAGAARTLDATKRQSAALVEEANLVKQLNAQTDKFAGDFADAMYDATQSGKYDFQSMINSMISDLGRLIWKQSMLNLYAGSSLQSGLQGILGGLVGGGTPTAASMAPMVVPEMGPVSYKLANGGSFNSGVQMFAKGGTFSNSIVNSPTLFKFAKGTGMMGEAGPEAIMPLKRDANGRLGVSGGGGGQTSVVVNNYSGQQVETHESVDSRGQRKIEVSVGNMVAGEIMRSGSMAQQSIKNTFGKQPQLIRR